MKIFEVAYKTASGDFHRDIVMESELKIAEQNIKGDCGRVLYCREVKDSNDIRVIIRNGNNEKLRFILDNCVSELYDIAKNGRNRKRDFIEQDNTLEKDKEKQELLNLIRSYKPVTLNYVVELTIRELYYRTME